MQNLKLRFPVTRIAEKTGYKKTTVSEYLNNKEPSEAFLRTFSEHFEIDFDEIWTGPRPEPPSKDKEPTLKEILMVLAEGYRANAETLKSIESKMAREDSLTIIKASLNEALTGVETIAMRQGPAIEKILADLDELKRRKNGPS